MTMLSVRREVGEFRKRYKWMALFAAILFFVLFSRMVYLQLVSSDEWQAKALDNTTKTFSLPAARGLLLDSRGEVVARNRPSYVVYLTPQRVTPEVLARFGELMELDEETLARVETRLSGISERRQDHQIEFFEDITRDQAAALQTHRRELAGAVNVLTRPMRTYPHGALAAHAIGYMNEVSAEDLERLGDESDYRAGDSIGRMGVERWGERFLRGRRGYRRVNVHRNGSLRSTGDERPPEPGLDLVLSLDMELMRIAERAFGGHAAGALVAVDVNSGRVRALFSKPVYNLNDFTGGMSHAAYAELRENPFRPLIDKTIYESYFPASTFKPVSALAGLEDGIVSPGERVDCIGYYEIGTDRKNCTASHGEVDLRGALAQSCNVYFYYLAEHAGLERLNRFGRIFGLGSRTGIGINSEASGLLPSRQWYIDHFGRYREGNTLNAAIGQGNTRVTLIQLALAYGAIANGGDLYAPQVVESIRESDGTLVESFQPQLRRHLEFAPDNLELVREGLWGAVNSPGGTAYEARIPRGVEIAGKTGTAEIDHVPRDVDPDRAWYFQRDHAWFAGYAPASDPEIAIVVLVEHGGGGGRTAAPIGIRVLEEYLGGERRERAFASSAARGGDR